MKKILVISDVHGDIKILNKILEQEKNVDLKIFAGDLQMKDNSTLKSFDYVISGNSDYPNDYPNESIFDFSGKKFFLVHGHKFGSLFKKIDFDKLFNYAKDNDVDIIIHGHDHVKASETRNGILRFNPGSTTNPRDGSIPSYGIIEIFETNVLESGTQYIQKNILVKFEKGSKHE